MSRRRRPAPGPARGCGCGRRGRTHAARVALVATLLVGVVYVGCVIALNRAITGRLVAAVDSRLHERLSAMLAGHRPDRPGDHAATSRTATARSMTDPDNDVDEAPVFVWRASPGQRPVPVTDGAPALPAAPGRRPAAARPRYSSAPARSGWSRPARARPGW